MIAVVAYISGYSSGRKHDDAAFSVYLRGLEDSHRNLITLKESTMNEAELHALHYALSAVSADRQNIKLSVMSASPYVYGMFQKAEDKWNNVPKKNSELIEEIRTMSDEFGDFQLKLDRKSSAIKKVVEESKAVHKKLKEVKANASV